MTETSQPAWLAVRANFDNADYRNVCATFGAADGHWPSWDALGELLAPMPGWHFDIVNDGQNPATPLWSFGLNGAAFLSVHVDTEGRYACYDWEADKYPGEVSLARRETLDGGYHGLAGVREWLAARDGIRPVSLAQRDMASEGDWQLLKDIRFPVQVTWTGAEYHATVTDLKDPVPGATAAAAIGAAAAVICRLYEAPEELAPELTIAAEFDPAAVRHLLAAG